MKELFKFSDINSAGISEVAQKVIENVPRGSILILQGDVGSGKTTFISVLSEKFGLKHIQSPTFAVHNHYVGNRCTINHFDLYRIQNEEELESVGFWDLIAEATDYALVEWADNYVDLILLLNKPTYELKIIVNGDTRNYQLIKLT